MEFVSLRNLYFSVNYKLSVTHLHSYLEEQNCFSIMFVYLFIGYRINVNVKMKIESYQKIYYDSHFDQLIFPVCCKMYSL